MSYFLLIDKPAGMTSHDVVDRIRRWSGERRVGHAGTLDPFATGLLIVGVGREATREFPKLVGLDKTYEAVFVLGASSDTDDVTGTITLEPPHTPPCKGGDNASPPHHSSVEGVQGGDNMGGWEGLLIEEALQQFVGEIEQVPPAYSAVKIGGKKMYEAARAGQPLNAAPRKVTVYSIELRDTLSFHDSPASRPDPAPLDITQSLSLTIHCSSGTYIRALARDLGHALGTGGYVHALRRTAIGPFTIEESTPLNDPHPIPINTLLSRL